MPFVKLDCGMLDSTIWFDRESREVFITALLMAEPKEFKEAQPQFQVDSNDATGWFVPAGWYGFVPASGEGIIRRCGIEKGIGITALCKLGSADPYSRTPDYDGRRLVRVDGGFIVLNFMRYRDRDYTGAERQKRWRERRKRRVTPLHNNDVTSVTQAEAEAEVYPEEVLFWNSQEGLSKVQSVSAGRKKALKARRADPYFVEHFKESVVIVTKSKFCMGQNEKGWKADFDWMLRPDTVTKIMEGKYAERTPINGGNHTENPRNAGTAKPVSSVAETVRRRQAQAMARQVAQAQNNPQLPLG